MQRIYSSALESVIYRGDMDGGNTGLSAWNFRERHATWAMDENGDPDPDLPVSKQNLIYFRGELSDVEIDVLARLWFSKRLLSQRRCRSNADAERFPGMILQNITPYHGRYGFNLERTYQVEIVRHISQWRCAYQTHGMRHLLPSWYSRVQLDDDNVLDILNLLQRTRMHQASDPRDKIFGLLGISSGIEVDDQGFAVDYSQPCRTVYMNFARHLISTSKLRLAQLYRS